MVNERRNYRYKTGKNYEYHGVNPVMATRKKTTVMVISRLFIAISFFVTTALYHSQ